MDKVWLIVLVVRPYMVYMNWWSTYTIYLKFVSPYFFLLDSIFASSIFFFLLYWHFVAFLFQTHIHLNLVVMTRCTYITEPHKMLVYAFKLHWNWVSVNYIWRVWAGDCEGKVRDGTEWEVSFRCLRSSLVEIEAARFSLNSKPPTSLMISYKVTI